MKKTIIACVSLALAVSCIQAQAALDTYDITEAYAPVLGSTSTFNGEFTFNTGTDLITSITGTLYDGVVLEHLSLNPATFETTYYPPSAGLPPESSAAIGTNEYTNLGDTFEDVYDLSVVSTNPTEFWSLPNNLLYRDNVTFGTYSTLAVESYTITEVSTVPEPSAISMMGVGSVALVGAMLGKRRSTTRIR